MIMTSASRKNRQQTALITGAANGLGYEMGRLYAKAGCHLVLVDKDGRRLKRIAGELKKNFGVKVGALVQDLSEDRAPNRIEAELEASGIRVDVILNRAGYRIYGPFSGKEMRRELQAVCRAFRVEAAASVAGPSPFGRLFPALST
jgi:uncharacterized protein